MRPSLGQAWQRRMPGRRAQWLRRQAEQALSAGQQPAHAREAYAAEMNIADRLLEEGRHREAAEAFQRATGTAFHRVLHFDHPSSPLANDPSGFTAPLRNSTVARAIRAPRGRSTTGAGRLVSRTGRTRLLILTRKNADFLGEIREHLEHHPKFETRFVDFPEAKMLTQLAKDPTTAVEQLLGRRTAFADRAERLLRPHLDWADVAFVEWCTALAALITFVDPRDTRIVVRLHSYEVFSRWPHLMDFSRVDDMVFVSDHLRELAVAAIPALREPGAPRLHVLSLAMDLQRFQRPKLADTRFTVGVVGASKVVKDPLWAMDVLRLLRRHDDRYRLRLLRGKLQHDKSAATQEYAERWARAVDELGPAVEVLSHTDDVPTALEGVGVVLSSSIRESFHIGLVEGAASGAVPVVRNWPFFPDAARSLFPPEWVVDTPEQAAARILQATASEEAWRDAGRRASEHVIERWDWRQVQGTYEQLLRADAAPSQDRA